MGGLRELTYAAAGNVTYDSQNGPGYGYNYAAAGRMSSFAINGVIQSEYENNYLGQQVIRRLIQTGQVIHAVHDALGNRIAEHDYDEAGGTSTLIREYIWASGTIVGVVENGALYFVRTDHIGRPVFATDDSGAKVWEASYLPFGGVETSTGANSDLRFPGQWFQSETGLHQNWMLDYDPTLGRYLRADPLGLLAGQNLYGYALNNPHRYIDPDGRNPLAIPVSICARWPHLCKTVIDACISTIVSGAAIGTGILMSTPDDDEEDCECEAEEEIDLSQQMPDPAEVDKSRSGTRGEMGAPSLDPDSVPPQDVVDGYYNGVGGPFDPHNDIQPGRQQGTTADGGIPRQDTTSPHSDGFDSHPGRPRR